MSDGGLLEVQELNAYYGPAHVLQGLDFSVDEEPVSIIGRNGMGKTTMCHAIMGIHPGSATGSIRFGGLELLGKAPYKIARAGIALVPQGRRLFGSLTVREHLRVIANRGGNGQWTPERIYTMFPRLAERQRNDATQLSGGEQQMLAIGRALLLSPKLLILDEPSEGLAPRIVDELVGNIRGLAHNGVRVLLVEQNLGVATAVAERHLVMVAGRLATELTSDQLMSDPELQRRYLGVEPLSD
ncbi:MAG: ABC transporter ATP-binding protein [Solirubrobacterales bacterium]|nr:ABC transporter ATP-binding protein [Solirubrobacterales bacterium]MBV9798114.1 ABC transporter ATP-binding protein [Solirubrobacterales bacterium]